MEEEKKPQHVKLFSSLFSRGDDGNGGGDGGDGCGNGGGVEDQQRSVLCTL